MIESVISYRNNRLQVRILQRSQMWKVVTVLRNNVSLFYFFNYFGSIEFSWGNLSYLLCASPSGSSASALSLRKPLLFCMCFPIGSGFSASALPLGKPLLFSGCFPSYRCSRLGTDPDRGRCQAIPRDIGETSIIQQVLPHHIPRRAHWGNFYHLVGASPSYSPASALGKGNPN